VLFTKYYLGDEIKKNEIDRTLNTWGGEGQPGFWWENL
jgi:hypothetical protein